MSKDTERKALAKIQKIVEDLGENSYLASAFTGAFEIAETNIDWDAAFTLEDEINRRVEEGTKKIFDEALRYHEEASKRLRAAQEIEQRYSSLEAADFATLYQRLTLAADALKTKLGY